MIIKRQKKLRGGRGISAIEIAVASFTLLAMTAIAIDATIFTMGYARLDATTRDAARAAAGQQKTSTDAAYPAVSCANALLAAQTQLTQHKTDGHFILQPTLTQTVSPYFVYQDFGGNTPPGNQSPYVTVTCSEVIILPIPINFFGASFGNYLQSGGKITLSRQYTFPIVKTAYYPAAT
jgi:Flp pilus assembly protein TadG